MSQRPWISGPLYSTRHLDHLIGYKGPGYWIVKIVSCWFHELNEGPDYGEIYSSHKEKLGKGETKHWKNKINILHLLFCKLLARQFPIRSIKNEILELKEKWLHNIPIIEQISNTLLFALQYKWIQEMLSHLKRRHQKSSCERFSSFVLAGFPGSRHQSLSIQLPPCALVVHSNNVTINGTIHVESETYFWHLLVWKPLHCEAFNSYQILNPIWLSFLVLPTPRTGRGIDSAPP